MKILMLHNRYKILGGEDIQTDADIELLKKYGVEVDVFFISNDQLDSSGPLTMALNTLWSRKYYKELITKIRSSKYDIIHVQNFFPILSPSIFYAAKKAGSKIVMTVHNYRLICPNALLFIDGKICHDCVGKTIPFPALKRKCYRDSFGATATTVAMLGLHNILNTWQSKIDGLICISEFVKGQLIKGGFKQEQLFLKYNFVNGTFNRGLKSEQPLYIYVGRISHEKGIKILLESFSKNGKKLIIIGQGPLSNEVEKYSKLHSNIEYLGKRSLEETYQYISKASALIFPSQWDEPFGRTIIEAFAHGVPVIGSSSGAVSELLRNGHNGYMFEAGNGDSLQNSIEMFESNNDSDQMRANAFNTYKELFTEEVSFNRIMEIYKAVLR